jgi:hypothetical protein
MVRGTAANGNGVKPQGTAEAAGTREKAS